MGLYSQSFLPFGGGLTQKSSFSDSIKTFFIFQRGKISLTQ
jgi:hypothetical protein